MRRGSECSSPGLGVGAYAEDCILGLGTVGEVYA